MEQNFIFYTKQDYEKAYTELLEILKYIEKEDLEKIPISKLNNYKKNRNMNYHFQYNVNLPFESQSIMYLTKLLLANLYIEYIATEEEKSEFKKKDREELYKLELEKQEKYKTDDLFKNRQNNNIQTQSLVIVKEENFINRIINKIKRLFRSTKA